EKFERREAAAARLVQFGRAAEPALTAAATGGDPEMARRARLLLDRLKHNIPPETPQTVASILVEHFAAPASDPQGTIVKLGPHGPAGWRAAVLVGQRIADPKKR